MKNKKTYYLLILDSSGSMSDCLNETISGFNEQIQMINDLDKRFPEQEFRISLTTFNHLISHPFKLKKTKEVSLLTNQSYVPDGSTALLDAIGESVISLKATIQKEIDNDEATAVVVILTDGCENASRIFNWDAISKLIRELEETQSWTFSFLGATLESLKAASRINIKQNNTAQWSKTRTRETMINLAESFTVYASEKSRGSKPSDFLKK